jgi:hypothetical protein
MDSSAYTMSVGQSVTFTARVIGNGAAPTGTMAFKASGSVIAGCSAIAVSNGQAQCTTTALAAGSYQITGTYSGDSAYQAGVAGPITETVNGAAAAPLTLSLVSSTPTSTFGENVTFTLRITGGASPTGTVQFTDGKTVTMLGCGAVPIVNGVASCTRPTLYKGTHQIYARYSGDSQNSAALAGPVTLKVN